MTKPFKQGRFADLPEKPRLAHTFFDIPSHTIDISLQNFEQSPVHYRKFGKGEPLLLVHGFMTSAYSWRYMIEPLGKHFTCYAVDLPGAGDGAAALDGDYSPAGLAHWLAAVMKELNIYGCKVIGNSMGGYLSMHLALLYPDAIKRLINLHSPGIPELRLEALNLVLFIPGAKSLLKWILQRDPYPFAHSNVHYYDESLKSLEEARHYGDVLASEEGALALIKYFDETMNIGNMRRFRKLVREWYEIHSKFPCPLQLIYAEEDPMVSPRFGTAFKKQMPDADLIWLQEASHFAHVDNPPAFLEAALPFLQAD